MSTQTYSLTKYLRTRIFSIYFQVIPPHWKSLKGDQIRLPVIRVSGQDKPFLKPAEVELCYCSAGVANLDERFLPVGKTLSFFPKYGVLLRKDEDSQGKQTWKNWTDDVNAALERTQKDRIRINFSVEHFSE